MRKRLLKYLKRLVILLVILGSIGVGVFTWFCYWPLEGGVEDLLYLTPEDAEFVLRGDWEDIESTGWIQRNLLDDPLHPRIQVEARKALREAREQIQEIERQINENIPFDFAKFSVEEDVLKGDVVVSGHWCPGSGPDRGPPKHQELLVLTRVSWKTKCVAALKHGFIREQMGPRLDVTVEDNEIYKLVFPFVPVLPERMRSVCGGGFIIPPANTWYLRRVKDVLAVSNSRRMIRRVAELAEDLTGQGSFAARPGFDIDAKEGKVVAAINVQPLHNYFKSVFHYYPDLKPLGRFLPPEALEKLSGALSLRGSDLLGAEGEISYFSSRASEVYQNVYALPQSPVREGISLMVPAKDTFAALSVRVDPLYLLRSIVKDMLNPEQRALWERNIRGMPDFNSIEELLTDLSQRIGDHAMIAVARLSHEFDKIEYKEMFSPEPDAEPAAAVLVRIKEEADQDELDAYMAKIVPIMGFEIVGREKRGDYTFTRCKLRQEMLDYKFVTPCFVLANNYLILTTNEGYMRQVLDAVADPTSATLASDKTFIETMGALPERGQVGIFVDLEKMFRIPEHTRDGAGPPGTRGIWWDQRNAWVRYEKDSREEMIRYRNELTKKFGHPRTAKQEDERDELVAEHAERWERELYPDFEEERRLQLEELRRFRGIGIVFGADDKTIRADIAITFREGESWLRWRR